ncbi:WcaF family extracellular polysaccharide biosynthesis acetyltransferase [Leeuwenhoekiella sp. H156]|uniref:WcaF family extracellular polysaccharide biosynthesis acetyltransferase n=1 Tax=Leeuwenhoekiella sp. H156 TaxID=3450128 RepID=UPI003FA4948D
MTSYQDLNLFRLPDTFRGRSKITTQLWWIVQSTLFSWSPQVFYGWRRFLLRLFGAKIGKGVLIRPTAKITYPWNIEIGDYSWIGEDNVLYSLGKIYIGRHVALAHKVYLNTGGHEYNKTTFDIFAKPVYISDECWLTNDVYIAPGVSLAKGTIIAARSSVLKSILEEGKICAGTPARIIKDRLL